MLVVKLFPPIRDAFQMAVMEKTYATRLSELYENNQSMLEREYIAHCAAIKEAREPLISRWKTFNTIAMIETSRDLLPYERRQIFAEVWIEP